MNRFDPTQIVATFREQDVQPVRGLYTAQARGRCYACALGLAAIAKVGFLPAHQHNWRDLHEDAGLGRWHAEGLSDGWERGLPDGPEEPEEGDAPLGSAYKQGRRDGAAARQACVDAGMTIVTPSDL